MEPVTIGRATHIYGLCDEAGQLRYIGKTVRLPKQRLAQHRRASRKGELPVNRWLRKHPGATVKLLEVVPADGDWVARERFWIESQDNLLNLTTGGEGLPGHVFTEAHRAKIASALRTGAHFNCETCSKQFWRKRRDIECGNCRFCSRECYSRSLKGVSRPLPRTAVERGVSAAAAARRAQTHCKRGHPLSGDNLFRTTSGGRGCKECRKLHKRTYLEKARG